MKIAFNFYLIAIVLLVASCGLEKKAEKSFELARYQESIELYNKILAKNESNGNANYYVAESYRLSNRINKAEDYYVKAMDNGIKNDSIMLNYAFAQKAQGKYDEARSTIEKYLKTAKNEKHVNRANEEFDNLDKISELKDKRNYYRVKNMKGLNSEHPEYAPVYNDGQLFFTSNRGNSKIYMGTGTPFTNIYQVKTKGAKVDASTIKALPDVINNNDINEGAMTFSPDGKTMVFSRGNSGKLKGTKDVSLYITRNRNGKWTEPRMLNICKEKGVENEYWDSTPAFSGDGKTLYFASNRKRDDSYGGTDLYSARMNARGRFYKVKNLGPEINTSGNEMFPYISDDGHLYFSSDGLPGFGGLDLYVARRVNGKTQIEDLGQPMNSVADDFGIYLFKADRGFFTSNREGGMGDDDIYTFVNEDPDLKVVNYFLEGVTMTHDDEGGLKILPNVEVQLQDYKGELIDETTTREDGKFVFRVYEHEHYNLVGQKTSGKDQYLVTREKFTTVGKAADRDTLTKLVTEIRYDTTLVLEKIERDKIFVMENIYYDLDKYDIRDDAALELDKLVTILLDNPDLKIELSSHTDSRDTEEYNLRLSQKRAESAVEYIVSQGIPRENLVARGYGESVLIIKDAQTEEEHQTNRRTEFKILELGSKKITTEEAEDKYFDGEEDEEDGN